MAIVHFPLKLTARRMIAPSVAHLSFRRDDGQPLDYVPGQFIQVHFAYADGSPARRSYSLATIHDHALGAGETVEIAVSYVPGGAVPGCQSGGVSPRHPELRPVAGVVARSRRRRHLCATPDIGGGAPCQGASRAACRPRHPELRPGCCAIRCCAATRRTHRRERRRVVKRHPPQTGEAGRWTGAG